MPIAGLLAQTGTYGTVRPECMVYVQHVTLQTFSAGADRAEPKLTRVIM